MDEEEFEKLTTLLLSENEDTLLLGMQLWNESLELVDRWQFIELNYIMIELQYWDVTNKMMGLFPQCVLNADEWSDEKYVRIVDGVSHPSIHYKAADIIWSDKMKTLR